MGCRRAFTSYAEYSALRLIILNIDHFKKIEMVDILILNNDQIHSLFFLILPLLSYNYFLIFHILFIFVFIYLYKIRFLRLFKKQI